MTTENFRLEKVRDFGLLFTDTFLFIKYNFKNLMKGMLYYVLPFSLLHGVVLGILQYQTMLPLTGANQFDLNYTSNMIYSTIGTYVFMFISYAVTVGFIMEYIKMYRTKGANNFELKEVGKAMLDDFAKILGALFLTGIIVFLGFMLLIIPGIYIVVCVSLVIPIIVFEDETIGGGINGCFSLIKNNWWNTLGFLFVMTLIGYSINVLFQLPSLIYQMSTGFFAATGDPMTPNKSITIFFSIIQTIGYALVQMLPFTAIAMQYFNLIERKESPALLKDLETVGNDD